MAAFINPFTGLAPDRKLASRELARAIRQALCAEQEAIHLYETLADATEHKLAKAVLEDVANEERVHAGEFQRVLGLLLEDEDARMKEGAHEVNALREALDRSAAEAHDIGDPRSVGDLKGGTPHE